MYIFVGNACYIFHMSTETNSMRKTLVDPPAARFAPWNAQNHFYQYHEHGQNRHC